jgi:hypothetical protein
MEALRAAAQSLEAGLRGAALGASESAALCDELAQALQRLRAACAPLLQGQTTVAVTADHGVILPAELRAFTGLLERQSLDAQAAFEALAPRLRTRLGEEAFTRLCQAVQELEFDTARTLVGQRLPDSATVQP